MKVCSDAEVTISANIEKVFEATTDCQNLPKFFTGYRAIPAIVRASTTDNLPLHEGSTRVVYNSDGSVVEEIITMLQKPTIQKYQLVKGLKPPFSWLVSSASGQWQYEAISSGTKVTWRFEFDTSNVVSSIFFTLIVKPSFQKAQKICLDNVKEYVEKSESV